MARKAVEANPKDRDLKLMLAGELADLGKTDEGLALAKGLLANTDEDRQIWLALGQMYVRAHRWKEAEDAFNKAETLTTKKEDRTYLLFLRGELAERQKHYEPAEQFFRQALELEPDNAMTLNYLGYMMADRGKQLPEALKMIRKAVELEPMNGAYLDSLGWVYFKMGEYELAEQNLRQAVERDQTDPTRPRPHGRALREDRAHPPGRGAVGDFPGRVRQVGPGGCGRRRVVQSEEEAGERPRPPRQGGQRHWPGQAGVKKTGTKGLRD